MKRFFVITLVLSVIFSVNIAAKEVEYNHEDKLLVTHVYPENIPLGVDHEHQLILKPLKNCVQDIELEFKLGGMNFVSATNNGQYTPNNGGRVNWFITDALYSTDQQAYVISVIARVDDPSVLQVRNICVFIRSLRTPSCVTAQVNQPNLVARKFASLKNAVPGSFITWTIEVRNNGQSVAPGVLLEDTVPEGMVLIEQDANGIVLEKPSGTLCRALLGSINPGQTVSRQLRMRINPSFTGSQITNTAKIIPAGMVANYVSETINVGTAVPPGIGLEMIDEADPLKVGEETVINIKVLNQGNVVLNNVRVEVELPVQLQMMAVRPSGVIWQNGKLVFPTASTLQPKQTLEYAVKVKGVSPGKAYSKVYMYCDLSGNEAITETELTNVYNPGS